MWVLFIAFLIFSVLRNLMITPIRNRPGVFVFETGSIWLNFPVIISENRPRCPTFTKRNSDENLRHCLKGHLELSLPSLRARICPRRSKLLHRIVAKFYKRNFITLNPLANKLFLRRSIHQSPWIFAIYIDLNFKGNSIMMLVNMLLTILNDVREPTLI